MSRSNEEEKLTRWLETLDSDDVAQVGGKNASLGEMIQALKKEGVRVPGGFATTAKAYREFLDANGLQDTITGLIDQLHSEDKSLADVGKSIRRAISKGEFSSELRDSVRDAYRELCKRYERDEVDVAVRSSATAEDLPNASFAGQQETFLNVTGEEELLEACKKCYASLFTDRAISYREEQGFDHMKVALSIGVQKMVRSDKAGSGVIFSLDTDTGFRDVTIINAAWGLGENVVQGTVNPDEYVVFKKRLDEPGYVPIIQKTMGEKEKKMVYARGGSKTTKNVRTSRKESSSFVLSDDEIVELGRWASAIESHYDRPMDMEWAKDGESGDLFIVQARPETVQSQKEATQFKTYELTESGEEILRGLAIGQAIASGQIQVIKDIDEKDEFEKGSILVTGMTDPDWVPIMKQAAGIVTDHGGRTSHAAIVSRELGVPAIVGAGEATSKLEDGKEVTMDCTSGDDGIVYEGLLDYDESNVDLSSVPETSTEIMMNLASPSAAFRWWRLPCKGVGLARMEFVINNTIKVHPMALLHPEKVDRKARKQIEKLVEGYEDPRDYFVDKLAQGIAKIAVSQHPYQVIVRMSDFKTNEYANLIGGKAFEPEEDNPMLGFRGASRYYSEHYREGFELECRAIKRARDRMGLENVTVMIPFCRTLEEADRVIEVLSENGLEGKKASGAKSDDALELYVMAEIPSNVLLAEEFGERFDGFSIGTNDLTQLVLGIDRDSEELSSLFDARNEAVKRAVADLIEKAHRKGCKVGICGQAPSDHPDFAAFLVKAGIDSISVNPDSVIDVIDEVSEAEKSSDTL
jgi:pyruvate,water dikinase